MKRSVSILLVDNQLKELHSLIEELESNGFRVTTYIDSQMACDEFAPNKYDLAIVSIRMQKLNGFDMHRHVRKHDSKIMVAFLTSFEINPTEFSMLFPSIRDVMFIKRPVNVARVTEQIKGLFHEADPLR